MIVTLFALGTSRHHHLQTTPAPTATSGVTVTSTALDASGILLGKHCALNSIISRSAVQLTSPGVSVPLTVTGSKATNLCITMTNESDTSKLLWLYTNVVAQPTDTTPPVIRFAEGNNFTDFGGSTPVITAYQTANNIPAGYFGPINWNSYLNIVAGTLHNYKFNVFAPAAKVTATAEADVVKACGAAIGSLAFQSKFAQLLAAALVALAFLF